MGVLFNIVNSGHTASNGALTLTQVTANTWLASRSMYTKSSGKWYWEISIDVSVTGNNNNVGVAAGDVASYPGETASSYGYSGATGNKVNNASATSYGNSYTAGDVIGIALDLDNGKIFFSKNNVWQNSGDPENGTNPAYTGVSGSFAPAVGMYSATNKITAAFKAADFTYSAPTGFRALQSATTPQGLSAKSVVVDIATTHIGSVAMMCRAIEFRLGGIIVDAGGTVGITCYGDAHSASYAVANAFTVSKSKIGAHIDNGWQLNQPWNRRIIVVFDTAQTFDQVVINNHHNSGASTEYGIKDVVITASTDEITSTTYGEAISNSTVLYGGEIAEHPATDTVDDQTYYRLDVPLWTPAEITTALWLDAADSSTITLDGAGVVQIDDKSGNDNHATQGTTASQPTMTTLNGEGALNFDGSNDFLTGTDAVWVSPWEVSVFAVASFGNNTTRQAVFDLGHVGSSTYNDFVLEQNTHSTAGSKYGFYTSAKAYDSACSTSSRGHIFGIVADGASGNSILDTEYMVDGVAYSLSRRSGSNNTYANPTPNKYAIGSFNGFAAAYMLGSIGEVIVIAGLVSETDRQKIEGYLAWKWGLESNLPIGHPYEDAAPTPPDSGLIAYWEQLYDLEKNEIINEIEQSFHLTSFLLNDVELLYGGPLQNTVRQFYSSIVPKISRIDQWYSSASILSKSLVVNYGYNQALAASFDQEYFAAAELLKNFAAKYNLNVGTINANIVTNYNLSERSGIQAGVNQKYHISSTINIGTVDFNIVIEGLTW